MDIWVIDTLNQLFIRGFYTRIKFQKNKVVRDKTPFIVISQICTPYYICLNIGFWQGSLVSKCCVFSHSSLY